MAGNLQGDNSGNIYVEFDYNNLIVVDPNKTIDAFGKIKERLVDHENLVMYANLEAEVLPRTKLAVGASPEDRQRTISVAKMNFLKPTKDTYLGAGYYDELTGENTTKFKGENQMLDQAVKPKDGTKPYIKQTVADQKHVFDNGLLGITQINVSTNSSFIPTVTMELEDVQGKALFQLGNNSPYAAFFNLPYPPFYLTLKGYYGQAIRYQLNLETFNARFNSFSGNYQVSLKFKGYKFNVLNEIAMGHLLATPHMYSQTFDVAQTPVSTQSTPKSVESQGKTEAIQNNVGGANQSDGKNAVVTQLVTQRGYQKIVEVYSEYKAKGLISPDFPELTLVQLMNKLDQFEANIVKSFPPAEVEPLTNCRNYKQVVKQYFDTVRGSDSSWFNTYLNPKPIVLQNNQRFYVFKPLELSVKKNAVSLLKSHVTKFNDGLAQNPTLGTAGPAKITNPITYEMIEFKTPNDSDINWKETAKLQGYINPSDVQIKKVQSEFGIADSYVTNPLAPNATVEQKELQEYARKCFIFEGNGRFDKEINQLETQANKKLSEYETSISAQLLRKIEDTATGIGFKPTVRNMTAVVMASAEAFIRLMDDVHTNAWNVKYDPIRKKAIMDNPSSAPSSETRGVVKISNNAQNANQGLSTAEEPVYPWPQFFVETPDDKKGRFQLKYIADPSVVDMTNGWDFSKWPEVEFVEEYMKGLTQKFYTPPTPPPLENQTDTNIININAIEYPSLGLAYANKEEIKFFYEIWERQFLTSHYSGLVRANSNQIDELIRLNIETETNNIKTSLGVSAPYLTLKLKNFDLTASNYPKFLSNISNSGTGRAYQDFIRDFYVTPYIKSITENSFSILGILDIGKIPQTTTKSDALASLLKNASNEPLIVDTLPYTDPTWSLNNLEFSEKSKGNDVYNTKSTLTIFEPRKIISNFNDVYNYTTNRPVTNFSYLVTQNPTAVASVGLGLYVFYATRKPKNFVPTEGYCESTLAINNLSFTSTTSMLNTPYFTNAIQNGVYNFRRKDKYPYVQAAYLFLNSLPLASLRERYKTNNNNVMSELDYISSCFKKFGAIHKLPYAWILKYGSIWHRYKKYTETGVDILSTAWTNFNYVNNYSPINNSTTQTYSFKYPVVVENKVTDVQRDVTLQTETTNDVNMQVGFYPKLINDFNVFYNGYDLYKDYTNEEIQKSVNSGMKMYNFTPSNIDNAKQNGKQVRLITWSVMVPQLGAEIDTDCNPKNNTKGTTYFVIPSFGTNLNQTKNELINSENRTPTTVVNLTSNTSVYNGSVRCLWSSPNYGYFNNDKIAYPQPDSYINKIQSKGAESPFSLLAADEYSKIEEMFSVFDKKILDQFEVEFLNFSRPLIDANVDGQTAGIGASPIDMNANFKNFQSILKSLMTVPAQTTSQTETEYFNNVINNQNNVFFNGVRAFMEFDVIVRYGNPSNYNRRVFDSYLSYLGTPTVTDPITFKPYVQGSLPQKGTNVSLTQSRTKNPAAWTALLNNVGFSTISGVAYSSTGSYFTDFFIDNNIEFTAQNVIILAPLIKMYATQKLRTPSLSVAQFKNQLTNYLNQESNLQNNFLNGVLSRLRQPPPIGLPYQQQLPGGAIASAISGEQSKVENYEVFKALNDKWIAGGDYKSKTLFEDIMFLDRASRNIGDTILVDIFEFKNMFNTESLNQAMSVYTFVSGMLIKNNFNVMNLPAYVNFYNVQDVDGTTNSNATEGSLQFADRMWGTYLDVDYRNSSPKMVCFYAGKPSQYLDLPKGNFRFRDDAFEMRRASENPLLENQQGKKDWAVSNKCVGFTVDLGIRNQNVFYSFSVSQENGVATSESINTQLNMVDQATGRNTATQNVSLYNLYKNRSYKCNVVCLGNALLQPTMYFNLRHVPMFNGPYMIMDVQHSIQQGNFQTSFTGVRQGIYDLPAIDSFLQSINQNLLTKLEEALKIKQNDFTVTGTTNETKTNQVVQKADNTLDTTNSCVSNLNPVYATAKFQSVNGTPTNVNPTEFASALKRLIPNSPTLQTIIYCISYVRTFQASSNTDLGSFNGWNHNLGTISLNEDWSASSADFLQSYGCVNVKTNAASSSSQPMAQFTNLDKYINFMYGRLWKNEDRILDMGLAKYYVCYWPKNSVDPAYYDSHIADYAVVKATLYKALDSAVHAGITTVEKSKELKTDIKKTEDKGKSPGTTPTPPVVTPKPGYTCPPAVIATFSPTVGNTGTIVQLNGVNFETTKEIKIGTTLVPFKDVTIINSQTIRFSVPQIGTGQVKVSDKINITTDYGTTASKTDFTYDPAVSASQTSSPGGYNNPTSNDSTVKNPEPNTNPQPATLIPKYEIVPNSDVTTKLTVDVNPSVGAWNMENPVKMTVSTSDVTTTNNRIVLTTVGTFEATISNYVVNNVFTITNENIKSMLFDNPIPPFDTKKIKPGQVVKIQFVIKANAVDKIKNPQATEQSFNFNYNKPVVGSSSTGLSPGEQLSKVLENQPGSLVKVGETNDVDLPNYSGPQYYNIKKPAGGYITYRFDCKGLISIKDPTVVAISSLDSATIIITNTPGTKYTNVIEVKNLGTFQMEVRYTSDDLTWINPNTNKKELVEGSATTKVPFTL
jgi:hypothetical protein